MFLFLDLSLSTGWAHDFEHGPDGMGTAAPKTGLCPLPSPVDGRLGAPLELYERWFGGVIAGFRCAMIPLKVGFEAPVIMGRSPDLLLIGLAAVTQLVCYKRGVPCQAYNNQSIKKAFTGRGNAKKRETIARCLALGWEVGADDNRADAAAGWAVMKMEAIAGFADHLASIAAVERKGQRALL